MDNTTNAAKLKRKDTKCFFHRDAEAVDVCSECGKKICRECAIKYNPPVCKGCSNINTALNSIYTVVMIIFTVILGIIGLIIGKIFSLPFWLTAIITYALASTPYGWRTLNRLLPSYFIALPRFLFIIFIWLKFLVSFCIGIFAVPFHIVKKIRHLYLLKK